MLAPTVVESLAYIYDYSIAHFKNQQRYLSAFSAFLNQVLFMQRLNRATAFQTK